MKWLRERLGGRSPKSDDVLETIQKKFTHFLRLLEQNNKVLKIVGDMEEKAQGEFLFDINYIHTSISRIRQGVRKLIEEMVALGGDDYAALREQFNSIDRRMGLQLPGTRRIEEDDLTIPFDQLNRDRASSVGSKSAQLGEMRTRMYLPVPDGFAISGWSYKRFLDASDLQQRIHRRIIELDIAGFSTLVDTSSEIQAMVRSAPVPDDLAAAITAAGEELARRSGVRRFSLRSSAVGEDTLYSFAGQYASYLNVLLDDLVNTYREVVASKFTPQAIYYYLSHSLAEDRLAMSVGCVRMINSKASGVVYTRDPIHSERESVLVHSIYGLGKYIVDGQLTPDVFEVSRGDGSLEASHIVDKPVRLVLREEGGTIEEPVPEVERRRPSLTDDQVKQLTEYALRIEAHYGNPQDIEWALDENDQLYILQARPLRVIQQGAQQKPDVSSLTVVKQGGSTVCPGAGGGRVHHVSGTEDLQDVPHGAVLVTRHSFAGLITVMGKASAIVTETGGFANHMATIAREYSIPTLGGVDSAMELEPGREVTVDATGETIYDGIQDELIAARRPQYELFDDIAVFDLLKRLLQHISPLNLVVPTSDDFRLANCRTVHDVTRFCHQKAMEEMFYSGISLERDNRLSVRLRTDIPLLVNIISFERDMTEGGRIRTISEDEIVCEPMRNFWNGVKHEGWPRPPAGGMKGFMNVLGTSMTHGNSEHFSEDSFALLGKEYMIFSIRMGFHYTTVESMMTGDTAKNYVRMQYKEGGATLDRRERRIKLIRDILSRLGFEHSSFSDFLDTRLAHATPEVLAERLFQLGRLTMLTKQLDMALSNDSVAQWYTNDIMTRLGMTAADGDGK